MEKTFLDSTALEATASLLIGLGATEVFVFGSATELLGRPVDLVDLDDPTAIVRYLLGSGELVRVA